MFFFLFLFSFLGLDLYMNHVSLSWTNFQLNTLLYLFLFDFLIIVKIFSHFFYKHFLEFMSFKLVIA